MCTPARKPAQISWEICVLGVSDTRPKFQYSVSAGKTFYFPFSTILISVEYSLFCLCLTLPPQDETMRRVTVSAGVNEMSVRVLLLNLNP